MRPGRGGHASHDYDWAIVGSGFGGSVSALRLAERGYRVAVIEQGKRYADSDFASDSRELGKVWWAPAIGMRGIMKLTPFRHVTVISGVGVGGGSLVYANTLYVPHSDDFYRHPGWDRLGDWRAELAPHYETARRMLGVTDCVAAGASEQVMRGVADDLGVAEGFRNTPVGVYFGEPGRTVADPYFDGAGPERTGCVRCGKCLLGCRYGAKNTLVKNYLYLAEREGARVIDSQRVVDLRPLGGGSRGWELSCRRTGLSPSRRRTVTAGRVVLAGGALGTNQLLRACRDRGSLPRISDRLGDLVRTNSETITAATSEREGADYRGEVAITASVFPDGHTHFTNNTYGDGGDLVGLNFGPLTNGAPPLRRAASALGAVARHPRRWLDPRRLRGYSRRTIIFTVMQSTDTALRFRARRGPLRLLGPLETELSTGEPPESFIPIANEVASRAAERMGGYPQSSLAESLLGTPGTAHLLGGAVIGGSPAEGVVDPDHRVFGYENLMICDGSAVPANPGVNPSLTITAMAERAMSKVPDAAGGA
ncbi:MAG: GMC oxidoreductase [Solirubrobacterales bacterium]